MLLHAEIYNTHLIPELKLPAWTTAGSVVAERNNAVHDECSQSADAQHRELKQWRDPAAARGHECA